MYFKLKDIAFKSDKAPGEPQTDLFNSRRLNRPQNMPSLRSVSIRFWHF